MPIDDGFRLNKVDRPPPPPSQLRESTQMSLRQGLMALEPVPGTVRPSGWTTSSATTSTAAPEEEEAPAETAAEPPTLSTSTSVVVHKSEDVKTQLVHGFSDLPQNILEDIFRELPLKCDQHTLTLLSRKTYRLLVKDLYHTVIIDIASYPRFLGPLMEMLSSQNPGREHIRGVCFDQTNVINKSQPPSGFEQLACHFLSKLEDGHLEYFSWPADYSLKPNYSLSMWQDHPELENIELYETSWESSAEVKNAFSQFRNVISLRICPDSEVGLKNVNKILKNINAIVSLHVDLRTFRLPPQKDDNLVPTKLFQHAISASSKLNPNTHWKLSLTHLALWNVGLAPSSCDLWIHVLDLASLQVLELSHCDYVENFLAAMANDTREGQLQSLTINHRSPSDVDGHVFCNALEQYLEKASPLTKLVLRIGNLLRLPSWQHIALHGPELETLLLDLDGANNYSGDEMIKILECMTPKLRQLGFVEGETTDIKQIFKLCNPVTLYLLGASKAASSLNSHSTASDLDGIQYVFRRSAQGIFEAAERGYHAQMISDGLPFRLRVVALARYACQSTVENMLCYVKGEETFLRKKKQAMFGVELRDLTKCLEEVDILIGEPMIFGPGGRN